MYYGLCIKRDSHTREIFRWYRDNGNSNLRLNYPLNENSLVFDLGGYKGEWSSEIANKYNCNIYIFEPVPEFYSGIVERFRKNKKISVFKLALSASNAKKMISLENDGSSIYKSGPNQVEISQMDIYDFIKNHNIKAIDLIKINIEGGEYVLLKRMIETKIVEKCRDIQVQFHRFYPDAAKIRNEIRNVLQKTHFITYDYPLVWENWRRR
jgi:FkbM family methyltransferase